MYKRKLTDEEINAIRRNINEKYYKEVKSHNNNFWRRNRKYHDLMPGYDVDTGDYDD